MGVTYLLDTHVLLWLLASPEQISDEVRRELANRRNTVVVSAASGMEIATKVRLGRLDGARGLVAAWSARIAEIEATELPITAEQAVFAGSLAWEHRDPFDRLLAAQATTENMVLVTVDRHLLAFPGVRTLTW